MEKSESIGELAKALAVAQGEIQGAKKDAENPFFKSKYADLASVWEACRLPLSKNGLSVIQTTLPTDENGAIPVETLLAHSSGEWINGVLKVLPRADDPQSMGSAITYARRYALAAMVGVAPEEDDGNAASRPSNGNSTPKTAAQPKASGKANAAETVALKQSVVDVCKMLNAAGDSPAWTAKRVDEASEKWFGVKADILEIEPMRDLVKRLSLRLDDVKKGKKAKPQIDQTDAERVRKVAQIETDVDDALVTQYIAEKFPGKRISDLSLDALNEMYETLFIPF